MKQIFLLLILIPFIGFAQKTTKQKPKIKTKATVKPVAVTPAIKTDGFIINGDVKGFTDGTPVLLLNPQSGVPEAEAAITKGKFTFTGKLASPDFRYLMFNKQPPYIAIFMDNSVVSVTGSKDAVDKVQISGSPAHQDFINFNTLISPYQAAFVENAVYDSALFTNGAAIAYDFANKNSASFISPLSIFRFYQLTDDIAKTEELLNKLTVDVKATPMSKSVEQVLSQAKLNAGGYVMPDFTQNDTNGVPVSLSSFRGRYVLVDFWASWCGPCRRENPNVVAAYRKFQNKNFTVLGISIDKIDRKSELLQAIKEDNLPWMQLWDSNNALAQQFQISSIPQNFLLDPEGKVLARNLRGPALERKLMQVLK
jgi:peroxiredoxin